MADLLAEIAADFFTDGFAELATDLSLTGFHRSFVSRSGRSVHTSIEVVCKK